MFEKVCLFEQAALTLLKGGKIPLDSQLNHSMSILSSRMHAAHFISAEPQCYVAAKDYAELDPSYMGDTRFHPANLGAFLDEAEKIRSTCVKKGQKVIPFEVLGLNWEKRNAWLDDADFQIDTEKAAILASGDFASMQQALSIIRQRMQHPAVHYTAPLVIQNTGHYWDAIFDTQDKHWPQRKAMLRKLNIFFTAGAPETANLLAHLPFGKKVDPETLTFDIADYQGAADPDYAFSTTDAIKFGQTKSVQTQVGANGKFRQLIDLVGPFPSPAEKSYSFGGNALWEKYAALYAHICKIGPDKFYDHLVSKHGYGPADQINFLSHDGGLGFCLETANGARRIDLITEELFPNTYHRMNPTQMFPGVELAYLKRTDGLELSMDRMFKRVDDIVARDARFKREDLRAYDTSLFISGRLDRLLDAARRGEPFDPIRLGLVASFTTQTLEVSRQPKYAPGHKGGVPETEHYLIVPNSTLTRAQTADWHLQGPNAISFRALRQAIGARDHSSTPQPNIAQKARDNRAVRMGLLGTPEAVIGSRPSETLKLLKARLLGDYNIATRQGPDYWRAYKEWTDGVMRYAAAEVASNPIYNIGKRHLLDASSVFYYGPMDGRTLTDREKVKSYLTLIKAVVRNQVFNPLPTVADRTAAAEVLDLIEHKQMLGLIAQKTENLLHVVDGVDEAAEKIASIVREGIPTVTPVTRQFVSDGQVENRECMTMAAYLSATNWNKGLVALVDRMCYLAAVNGANLKLGGGNDGLMKVGADAFLRGKKELADKGYDFPNQLILIQCADTEAIEMLYEGGGIARCHPDIDSRMLDIQTNDFTVAGPGGAGSDEEILTDLEARGDGIISTKTPFVFLSPQMDSPRGPVGVYDPYKVMFSDKYLKEMGVSWSMTAEGVIDRFCTHRNNQNMAAQTVHVADLRKSLQAYNIAREADLTGTMNRASMPCLSVKRFRPPFSIYLGPEGELPPAAPKTAETRLAPVVSIR